MMLIIGMNFIFDDFINLKFVSDWPELTHR